MANLSAARAREVLDYSIVSGRLYWRMTLGSRAKAGNIAGTLNDGYIRIRIDGVPYMAHRLAWLLLTGEWPDDELDHHDGGRSNNAWLNLREADRLFNMQNQRCARKHNKVGILGVSRRGIAYPSRPYTAQIRVEGKQKHLGFFGTAEEAHAAYVTAKRTFHAGGTL